MAAALTTRGLCSTSHGLRAAVLAVGKPPHVQQMLWGLLEGSKDIKQSGVKTLPYNMLSCRGISSTKKGDHYSTLGVPRDASARQIRTAFLKKCKEFHPDTSRTKNTHSKFVQINEAHSVLGKSYSRKCYDQDLKIREQLKAPTSTRCGSRETKPPPPDDDYNYEFRQYESQRNNEKSNNRHSKKGFNFNNKYDRHIHYNNNDYGYCDPSNFHYQGYQTGYGMMNRYRYKNMTYTDFDLGLGIFFVTFLVAIGVDVYRFSHIRNGGCQGGLNTALNTSNEEIPISNTDSKT